ncbi:MAG TPA: peptide MFS transporter [Rhizomicrobium sp.]|jgi:POT family proton-dependent oligopeptide transporter
MSISTDAAQAAAPLSVFHEKNKSDTRFLGHPVGLGWLSGSEFWERFAYYGMQALLVLYLSHSLFTPGKIDHVWGIEPFHRALEHLYGKLDYAALASAVVGFYAATVYLTPLLGGYIADRLIGRTATVTLGASLMAAGYFLLCVDQTFLIGIFALLFGVGCFKGNIAAQVGDLYTIDDSRRADGFQVYFLGIQIAVIIAPLVTGTLGEKVGWTWGFGSAGVAILIGLAIYLFGRTAYPPEVFAERRNTAKAERPALTGRDWGVVAILVLLLPVLAMSAVGNQQIFNAYLIWSEKNYDLSLFGGTMPTSWMFSIDAVVSTFLMIGVIAFWRWYGRHWQEPAEITKIAIGTAISAFAPLTLALFSQIVVQTGHPVPLWWAIAFHVINDTGFSMIFPVGLALYSRAAPKGLGGIMIAIYYLHLFIGNNLIGYLGGLLDKMSGAQFWLLHSAIIAAAAVLLFLARIFLGHYLAPTKADVAAA